MTKRRLDTHEESLKAFSERLRKDIKENLKVWAAIAPDQAEARRVAYDNVVFLLKDTAREFNIPLVDLGLADYEVPQIQKRSN